MVELQHPALKKPEARKKGQTKLRRTTGRVAKLVNVKDEDPLKWTTVQVPIEPGFNDPDASHRDPTRPLRFYLDKGVFQFPHELEPLENGEDHPAKVNFIYCAVKDCWERAEHPEDGVDGERCKRHEKMWRRGLIRYPVPKVDADDDDY